MMRLLKICREFLNTTPERPQGMNIRFIKSYSMNPDNIPGYEVWSDEYTTHMECVGYISDTNLPDMVEYFQEEGYNVEVTNQYVFG